MNTVDLTEEVANIKEEAQSLTPGVDARKMALRIIAPLAAVASIVLIVLGDTVPHFELFAGLCAVIAAGAVGVYVSDISTRSDVAVEYLARGLAAARYDASQRTSRGKLLPQKADVHQKARPDVVHKPAPAPLTIEKPQVDAQKLSK